MGHGINEEMELVEPERRQEAASMKEMEHVTSTTTEKEREQEKEYGALKEELVTQATLKEREKQL